MANNSKAIGWIIAIIIIILIIAGIWWYLTHQNAATGGVSVTQTPIIATVSPTLSPSPTTSVSAANLKIGSKTGLGQFLTDDKGMTLYYFTKDKKDSGTSACVGQCITIWPSFYVANVTVAAPLQSSDFSQVTRSDGKEQLAYKGMPLYYYSKDKKSGETLGEGVNGMWYVVKP